MIFLDARRDLLGRQIRNFDQKVDPQGAFGRTKLQFRPESRPAGVFWADKIVFWGQKVDPQGPFGEIKLHFGPESRPAGAFWADKIVFWAGK